MDKHINFEYNEKDSEYTVSALPTAIITVMGVGRLTKAAAGGGAGGAAVGAVGGAGAGAGVGAKIGGPIGVAIGAGIGVMSYSWCVGGTPNLLAISIVVHNFISFSCLHAYMHTSHYNYCTEIQIYKDSAIL